MKKIFITVRCFLMTWAMVNISGLSNGSIWVLLIFAGCMFMHYSRTKTRVEPDDLKIRISKVSGVLSVILGFFVSFGNKTEMLADLDNRLFRIGILLITAVGSALLIYEVLVLLYSKIRNINRHTKADAKGMSVFFGKHSFSVSAGISFICYLPFFLYEYPGILTPDSINQLEQAMGVIAYSNHHPWVHTMLIKAIVNPIYSLSNNMNLAVAGYTLFQMVIFALAVGYFVSTIQKITGKMWASLLALAFLALVPFNAVMSITMWKDVPFSIAVVTLICSCLRLLVLKNNTNISEYILFTISGIVMSLFRSNGWYAFLIFIPFLLFMFRRTKMPMWILIGVTLLCPVVVKGPVMDAFDVSSPDFVESVAMPIQMVARVFAENHEVSDEQRELVEKVMDLTYIKEIYCEFCADNMKELVRAGHPDYLADHKGDYLSLWLSLGLKYPDVYLDAWIGQTRAYWYPEVYYTIAEVEGVSSNELGISYDPILRGNIFVKAREIWMKLGNMIPGYGILWGLGGTFWLLIIAFGNVLIDKNKEWRIFVPLFLLFGTLMIATPLGLEFRYVYYNSLALPVLLIYSFVAPEEESNGTGTGVRTDCGSNI